MRIGFLSTDWGDHREGQPGGCTNVRMMLPAHNLNQIGHKAIVGEIGWKDGEGFVAVKPYERLRSGRIGVIKNYDWCFDKLDVVILKLFMHKDASKYIQEARKLGQTVIIDTDDHFEELPEDNLAFITTDPEKNPDNNRAHLIATYSVANGIIASTKFLEKRMLQYNDTVYRVPNSLDPKTFMYRMDLSGNKPTIGWVGIMMWRVNDLVEVSAPLKTIIEQNDLKFHHSGIMLNKPKWAAEALNIDPAKVSGYTGARPQYYGNVFMPIDIGIVPLHPSPFNEAKSNLKGLEYALSGIPFVASSTQEYRDLAASGVGRIAKNNKEWLKHLKQLLDPEVREFERQKNYKTVVENYNIFTVKYKWSEAIELIDMKAKASKIEKIPLLKV
jgi:glycosyltransferase involved in cell wall biosynthesis